MNRRQGNDLAPFWELLDTIGSDGAGEGWEANSACLGVDSNLFYPARNDPNRLLVIEEAKRVCASCVVQAECLTVAVAREQLGIWGGATAHQRTRMRRELAQQKRETAA